MKEHITMNIKKCLYNENSARSIRSNIGGYSK